MYKNNGVFKEIEVIEWLLVRKYKPRLIDKMVERYLTVFGAISIDGVGVVKPGHLRLMLKVLLC